MENGNEIPQPKESFPELNLGLSYLMILGFDAAQTNFEQSYQGPQSEAYKKFQKSTKQIEKILLGPEDHEPEESRYVIRENYLNEDTGEHCINLAPLNKIDIFGRNQRNNHELDLTDGPVDELQISICKFSRTTNKADGSLSNSGYRISVTVKNYAFVENRGIDIKTKPAGLGITVLNDCSATSYFKNFINDEFAYAKPPTEVEDSKKTKDAVNYLSTLTYSKGKATH